MELRLLEGVETELDLEYPLVSPYSRYAVLYDYLDQTGFGLAVAPLVEQIARSRRPPVRRALDLACGTGTVALWLAARGYDVTGVDRSTEMLAMARAKTLEARGNVRFLQQEMTRLQLDGLFDLALCLYDSLNYLLTVSEMEAALAGVAGALSPGGIFIFDVNTEYCLANDWGNRVLEEHSPRALLTHLYSYDPATGVGTLELYCLHNRGDRLEKFREIHRERGYTREEIDRALERCGLTTLELFSFPEMGPPEATSSRLVYIVARPGIERRAGE